MTRSGGCPNSRTLAWGLRAAGWIAAVQLGAATPPAVAEGPATTPEVRVALTLEAHALPQHAPPRGAATVVATWFGPGARAEVRAKARLGSPSTLTLAPGRWVLRAEAKGLWGADVQLEAQPGESSAVLPLWPETTVAGGFLLPGRTAAPHELVVMFRPDREDLARRGLQPGKATCALGRRGWRCRLPAGVHDLRFQAPGFVPRYLWAVSLRAGEVKRLGRLDLFRGSAVLGWVVAADGRKLGPEVTVELRPRQAGPPGDALARTRLAELSRRTTLNEHGFFQLDGVAPGAYVIEARHPELAPALSTVEVVTGKTTEVSHPPLTLEAPKLAEVFIDPPGGPDGEPWRVELLKLDRDSSVLTPAGGGPAGADGGWRRSGLAPGEYLLRVGRGEADVWYSAEVALEPGSSPFFVRLPLVRVHGTVLFGRGPLQAELTFGGQHGAVRVKASSNDNGEFETYLPKGGDWPVLVTAEKPRLRREVPRLEVQPKPGSDRAEVEIHLAKTVLRGKVLGEDGNPVTRSIVSARSLQGSGERRVQVRTEEDGSFELLGLPQGATLVSAEAEGDLYSDTVIAASSEDEQADLVLVARAQTRVRGTVVSAAGPVAGATIKAAPIGVAYLSVRSVTSDALGTFELVLPPAAHEMTLAIGAPGFALRMLRLPIPADRTLAVGLEQAAGTLVIEHDEELDLTDANGPQIFVLKGGALEGLPYLLGWASRQGVDPRDTRRAVLPALEPGAYRACLVWPDERMGLEAGLGPERRCTGGSLQASGELTLKLKGLSRH